MAELEKRKRIQKQTDRSKIDKKCLDRLTTIHKLIKAGTYSGEYPTLDDLINTLSTNPNKPIGKATIYRDLALLSATEESKGFAAPLKFDREKKGYYYTNPKYEFGISSTTPEKLFSLITAKQLLTSLSDTPIYSKISDLTNFITENQDISQKTLMGRTVVASKPYIRNINNSWDLIISSISENRKIDITIKNVNKDANSINRIKAIFSPYRLIVDTNNYLFMEGLAEINLSKGTTIEISDFYNEIVRTAEKDEIITEILFLDFSKIDINNLCEETFSLPEDYESNSKYIPLLGKGKKSDISTLKLQGFDFNFNEESIESDELVIKARNEAKEIFKNYKFSDDQEIKNNLEDDSLTVTLTPKCLDVCKWLLSFGANITPISPQKVVMMWKEEVKKMYDICENTSPSSIDSEFLSPIQHAITDIINSLMENETIEKTDLLNALVKRGFSPNLPYPNKHIIATIEKHFEHRNNLTANKIKSAILDNGENFYDKYVQYRE